MIDITSNVKEVAAKIRRLPKQWEGAALDLFKRLNDELREIMARPGLPVTYPIDWDSEKQKRFVIAKLRAEDNLPYTRTGAHSMGWTTEQIAGGYMTANIGHQAVFLYGTPTGQFSGARLVQPSGQSHIFAGRWRLVHQVLEALVSRLPPALLEKMRVLIHAD